MRRLLRRGAWVNAGGVCCAFYPKSALQTSRWRAALAKPLTADNLLVGRPIASVAGECAREPTDEADRGRDPGFARYDVATSSRPCSLHGDWPALPELRNGPVDGSGF